MTVQLVMKSRKQYLHHCGNSEHAMPFRIVQTNGVLKILHGAIFIWRTKSCIVLAPGISWASSLSKFRYLHTLHAVLKIVLCDFNIPCEDYNFLADAPLEYFEEMKRTYQK